MDWIAFWARFRNACLNSVSSPSIASWGSWQLVSQLTPPRSASGPMASRTLVTSDVVLTGASVTSSGRTNLRNPCTTSSRRRISAPIFGMPRRGGWFGRREFLLQQLEVDRHRIEGVLHLVRDAGREPAERGDAPREVGQLGPFWPIADGLLQLRRHLIEHVAQIAELLVAQTERLAELPASQPGQAAGNHVNRPEHHLREEHRDADRDDERQADGNGRGLQRLDDFVADEDEGDADRDLAERLVAE